MAQALPDVDRRQIVAGLQSLGLHTGIGVMIHSSLSSFGRVAGGAETVIDALMEVVTPSGTLMVPSFNHGEPFGESGSGVYDPLATRTTNGAIPDHFWRRPDVYRSLNPTHAFAAWGKHARRYIAGHHRTLTMGLDSPLGLLLEDDGYGLLLGVDYRSNTFHHVVEMSTGAPCLGRRTEAYPVQLPDGLLVEGRTWGWRASSCPLTDGHRYGGEMEARELHVEILIGECRAILYRLRDCYELVAGILQTGADGYPPCRQCPVRPRSVAETVDSDWDDARGMLAEDSVAWEY